MQMPSDRVFGYKFHDKADKWHVCKLKENCYSICKNHWPFATLADVPGGPPPPEPPAFEWLMSHWSVMSILSFSLQETE